VLDAEESQMKAAIAEILSRRPTVGLAVGVVRDGRLAFFHAHGVADIASNRPITKDTVFRIASITKTITAVALLQLWEQGLVDLDAPANDYLRAYKLVSAKDTWRPATVRDLLTHTAGIPEEPSPRRALRPDFGESFRLGQPLPSLAEYYGGGLRLVAEPGTRFRYTDHGPATLGQLVEDVSGEPLDRYFREHIFAPLGMSDSDLLRSEQVASRLATGYELRSYGAKAVRERQWVTAGASSIYSTPRDMARYLAMLLGGGANEHGSVLKPATVASMFAPHFQPDPRMAGMGLAFFRARLGDRPAVEHQGTLPGFHSQIFLAPEDGIGVMAFTNGSWHPDFWLPLECSRLLGKLLGAPAQAIRTDLPQHAEIWRDLCGWYKLAGPLTDVRVRGAMGAGAEITARSGRLRIRFLTPIPALYRGFQLHPDDETDPLVFRADFGELGCPRVVFSRKPGSGTITLHLELMPLSLQKQPAVTNPRLWTTGALGALAGATAAGVLRRLSTSKRGRRPA
jgi:CubicO group peptidase (beta-lactamase class C family)